jgi:hypothetical protein
MPVRNLSSAQVRATGELKNQDLPSKAAGREWAESHRTMVLWKITLALSDIGEWEIGYHPP